MTNPSPDQMVKIVLDKWDSANSTPPTPHQIATILREANVLVGDAAILQVYDIVTTRIARQPERRPNLVDRLVQAVMDDGYNRAGEFNAEDVRKAIEQELMPRQFEIRGTITIDYAMGFSEAEAREWFPDVLWDDPDRSHAGDIETDHLDAAPAEFWHFINLKRDVVLDVEGKVDLEKDGSWKIREEVTGVIEL